MSVRARRVFWHLVGVAVGFWINEAVHVIYDYTEHAPPKRPA